MTTLKNASGDNTESKDAGAAREQEPEVDVVVEHHYRGVVLPADNKLSIFLRNSIGPPTASLLSSQTSNEDETAQSGAQGQRSSPIVFPPLKMDKTTSLNFHHGYALPSRLKPEILAVTIKKTSSSYSSPKDKAGRLKSSSRTVQAQAELVVTVNESGTNVSSSPKSGSDDNQRRSTHSHKRTDKQSPRSGGSIQGHSVHAAVRKIALQANAPPVEGTTAGSSTAAVARSIANFVILHKAHSPESTFPGNIQGIGMGASYSNKKTATSGSPGPMEDGAVRAGQKHQSSRSVGNDHLRKGSFLGLQGHGSGGWLLNSAAPDLELVLRRKVTKPPFDYPSFRHFARHCHANECIDFWEAVEAFQTRQGPVSEIAYLREISGIFETYVKKDAIKQININSKIREKIAQDYEVAIGAKHDATRDLFQAAQAEILRVMRDDTYKRYVNHILHSYIFTPSKTVIGLSLLRCQRRGQSFAEMFKYPRIIDEHEVCAVDGCLAAVIILIIILSVVCPVGTVPSYISAAVAFSQGMRALTGPHFDILTWITVFFIELLKLQFAGVSRSLLVISPPHRFSHTVAVFFCLVASICGFLGFIVPFLAVWGTLLVHALISVVCQRQMLSEVFMYLCRHDLISRQYITVTIQPQRRQTRIGAALKADSIASEAQKKLKSQRQPAKMVQLLDLKIHPPSPQRP